MSAWSIPYTAAWRCQWVNAMSRQKWSLGQKCFEFPTSIWGSLLTIQRGNYLWSNLHIQSIKIQVLGHARTHQDGSWQFLLPSGRTTNMSSWWKPLWMLTPIPETGSAYLTLYSTWWRFWKWPVSLRCDCIVGDQNPSYIQQIGLPTKGIKLLCNKNGKAKGPSSTTILFQHKRNLSQLLVPVSFNSQ